METVDKVLQVFAEADSPMRPGEVAEKSGLDRKDVDKAIKALKKRRKKFTRRNVVFTQSVNK